MSKIAGFTGQHLIAVQTVLDESYWAELTSPATWPPGTG
jgi:hypothetical protein